MTVLPGDEPRFIATLEAVLRAGHSVRFRAAGWSMHPTIRNGEIVTIAPLGESPIQEGDVVLCRRGNTAIAHRVVALRSGSSGPSELVLRGDAEHSCDRPVGVDQILGRVKAVGSPERTLLTRVLARSWSRGFARAIRRAHDVRVRARTLFPRRISLT